MQSQFITIFAFILATALTAQATSISNDHFTLWQYYSSAPNTGLGETSSWLSYVDNMRAGASSSGLSNTGDPNTPGYFTVTPLDMSWTPKIGPVVKL